jgi:CRP-like cAMP-binding protein
MSGIGSAFADVAGVSCEMLDNGEGMNELDVSEKSALIAQVDFFRGCTKREFDDIAKLLIDRHFATGDELCRQGDAETHGFVLVDGEAAVVVDGEEVGTATAGDVVGELAMLGTGRRTATLRASTPVHVLVIEPEEIDSVLSADPSSGQRLGRREHTD